jgi:hypothetical protein
MSSACQGSYLKKKLLFIVGEPGSGETQDLGRLSALNVPRCSCIRTIFAEQQQSITKSSTYASDTNGSCGNLSLTTPAIKLHFMQLI